MSREGEIMTLHCAAHMRGACDIQSLSLHPDHRMSSSFLPRDSTSLCFIFFVNKQRDQNTEHSARTLTALAQIR